MNKKLFTEEELLRRLPKEIIEIIEMMSPEGTERVMEAIVNSEEVEEFVRSIELPEPERVEKKSMLVEEVKQRGKGDPKKKERVI